MQTVFSQRLLAGLRARNSEAEDRDDTFLDPDDCCPRLSVTLKDDAVGVVANIHNVNPGLHPELPLPPVGAPAAAASAHAMPDLLDPVVLRTMPPRVAAFMLYEPRDPPPCRYRETAAEREFREQRESDGAWCG